MPLDDISESPSELKPQQLVARIKKSSKYWGQTAPNAWFPVRIDGRGGYCFHGNQNHYRAFDIALGIVKDDGVIFDLSKKPIF
jgi:hypothetical protein